MDILGFRIYQDYDRVIIIRFSYELWGITEGMKFTKELFGYWKKHLNPCELDCFDFWDEHSRLWRSFTNDDPIPF